MRSRPRPLKLMLFSLLPLLFLLLAAEVTVRVVYFWQRSESATGIGLVFEKIKTHLLYRKAQNQLQALGSDVDMADLTVLYQEEGRRLREELKTKYAERFATFLGDIQRQKARLYVLYIPSENPVALPAHARDLRDFFRGLAAKANVDFIDASPAFAPFAWESVTLLPRDSHLSRFGNQLLAKLVASRLHAQARYRSPVQFTAHERPSRLGDLKPRHYAVWGTKEKMPFDVTTNRQGLRMPEDLAFPKTRQRILLIGDSYTFGSYVPDVHTFGQLLQLQMPEAEIVNAGVAGYTIEDEAELFAERAKYTEPDIVVLQVLDNDLTDLLALKRIIFNRKGQDYKPTPAEQEFAAYLRNRKR